MKNKIVCIKREYMTALDEMVENAREIKYSTFKKYMEKLFPGYEWKSFTEPNKYFKSTFLEKACAYIRNPQNEYLVFTPTEKTIVMHLSMQSMWEHL